MRHTLHLLLIAVLNLGILVSANAEVPWSFDNNTRYMVMGDSLGAGYGARPQTQGYAYLLYKGGAFDKSNNTLLSNAAVMGVTSTDVYNHQVPQAGVFDPDVVTLTVGGNDLTPLFGLVLTLPPEMPLAEKIARLQTALGRIMLTYSQNLYGTIYYLCSTASEQNPKSIYIGNIYSIPLDEQLGLPAGTVDEIVQYVNSVIAQTITTSTYAYCTVKLADVYSEFDGQTGLLLIERKGASAFQIHPTNAGHRAMAKAFEKAIN